MTQQAQAEALRLADTLDLLAMDMKTPRAAAAELRRQHARVQELEEGRKAIIAEKDDMKYALRHARAQLEAQQAVPRGWVLVPVEPPEEMARAFRADDAPAYFLMTTIRCDDFAERYATMIAAAPTPPERERKPLTDEQIDALWGGEIVSVPQLVNRRAISRSIERAHGIGATNG